jgi:hypothetical protein
MAFAGLPRTTYWLPRRDSDLGFNLLLMREGNQRNAASYRQSYCVLQAG